MNAPASATLPLAPKLNVQLSIMMFLQYGIWGAWLPLFWSFLTEHRGLSPALTGNLFAVSAIGALVAPFIAGQLADRYFNTEKFLGLSHIVGGILVWQLAYIKTYGGLLMFGLLYSMVYAPTLALSNSLAFHHLPDRDRDFGKVRVWGTIGWIAVGIGIGQWLLHTKTPLPQVAEVEAKSAITRMVEDSRPLAAAREDAAKEFPALKTEEALLKSQLAKVTREGLSGEKADKEAGMRIAAMTALETSREAGVKSFPDLKPEDALLKNESAKAVRRSHVAGMADSFRLSAILGILLGLYCFALPKTPPKQGQQKFAPWEALGEVKKMPLLALFLICFPVSLVHQFYFVHTAGFLGTLKNDAAETINMIFGVGGGGLMTIGQMAEILVLAFMPIVAKKVSRKTLLAVGLGAYILRFAAFAFTSNPVLIIPALALHGLCFGCLFFVAFLIVDEETSADVRASAQGLFNLVIIGFGIIAGNWFAGLVGEKAGGDFRTLFGIPMGIAVACLAALLTFYPSRPKGEAAPAA